MAGGVLLDDKAVPARSPRGPLRLGGAAEVPFLAILIETYPECSASVRE
jgi:hypothetical protein